MEKPQDTQVIYCLYCLDLTRVNILLDVLEASSTVCVLGFSTFSPLMQIFHLLMSLILWAFLFCACDKKQTRSKQKPPYG